jgi:hypothetical protein
MRGTLRNALLAVVSLMTSTLLCSCSGPPETVSIRTIEAEYAGQIYKLSPGMPKEQVQRLFPGARPVYHKSTREGDFELLEVRHTLLSYVAYANIYQRLWFCMRDDRLADWGELDTFEDRDNWLRNDNLCPCEADEPAVADVSQMIHR